MIVNTPARAPEIQNNDRTDCSGVSANKFSQYRRKETSHRVDLCFVNACHQYFSCSPGRIDGQRKVRRLGLLFPIAWREPFGLVIIEAMACGTPVIAYPLGSVPEVIEEGVTGFMVVVSAATDSGSRPCHRVKRVSISCAPTVSWLMRAAVACTPTIT